MFLHESLVCFVERACNTHITGLSPHELAQSRKALDACLTSMASCGDDVVYAIVRSVPIRKTLLEIVANLGLPNDPNLRAAQRSDSERIATVLITALGSEAQRNAILNLSGDSAHGSWM
ncbi:hypothetical protein R3P38DRAFT_2931202 [Favolaschia claudopus]|uniref:Uncharacterized protein n=1 Tax=Favolaschia claudopus TaxID=2862362 RepID=A0AAW0BR05_9AGAR